MRDSRAHVEASGRRPQGRLSTAVRHRRGGRVRDQPAAPHRLLRRYRDGGLEALEPRSRRPRTSPQGTPDVVRDRIVALRRELSPAVSTRGRSPSPGTWGARACQPRRPRPSGASSTRPGSSCPSRASARAAPGSGSRPPRPTRSGSPTSPTGGSPMAARSRSSAGSTTTPATCSAARRSGGSPATTWWPPSPRPAMPTAGPPPRSPTTAPCTRPASPVVATASSTCSPGSASARRTGHRATPRPRARSSASTRRSSAGSARQPAARTLGELQAQLDAFRPPTTSSGRTGRSGGARRPRPMPGEPKAHPAGRGAPGHFRLRYDIADGKGAITLRRAGRLHHLNGRCGPRPTARPGHRRRAGGHGRRPRHGRGPLDPPHRARQGVLAQPTTRPRPMAGVSRRPADAVSRMSRLMCRNVATQDNGARDRIRTCDMQLGRPMLYPLSYGRDVGCSVYARAGPFCAATAGI